MKIRIVMVEPHEAGNVGAAARAMKNFGVSDLVIAGSRELRHDTVSDWWAKGADDLVRGARRVATLEEALEDCHLSIATTAVRKRHVFEQLTPREVAELAGRELGPEHRVAVVFGREEWGLTTQEIGLCQRTASIPTSPDFPTMNLAQSVGIFCYELTRRESQPRADADPVPGGLLETLHRETRQMLLEIGFLNPDNPDRVYEELRALAGRTLLTTREASVLLALVRKIRERANF